MPNLSRVTVRPMENTEMGSEKLGNIPFKVVGNCGYILDVHTRVGIKSVSGLEGERVK